MSAVYGEEKEEAADVSCCVSCGKAAVDNVKLKICTACKLVKYCSVECQKNHRPMHKKACKKRATEIRDDNLFQQPDESYLGECPICCLPLPFDIEKWTIMTCCCKYICKGCAHANYLREAEQGLEQRCPYCREPVPKTVEERDQNYEKRVKADDPVAIFKMGSECQKDGDFDGAFEYWTKSAELGFANAHQNLSSMYYKGDGVEKDKKKEIYHLEEAAIGGHPHARCNLGFEEYNAGKIERAMRHFIIAAKLGYDNALEDVKKGFTKGFVSKEDYASALRGHQAAVDATKSAQRDEAEKARREGLFH